MAHFAKIEKNENNKWIVKEVHSINNDTIGEPNLSFPETEIIGQNFQKSIGLSGIWKQTSFNNNFRKQYAGIGYEYDDINDIFISPQPYASWTLDENFDWQAPIPSPGLKYFWNEDIQKWEKNNLL
jgi:hypothetical protein